MKSILSALLSLFIFTGTAYAATEEFIVDGVPIQYEIPAGFISADTPEYDFLKPAFAGGLPSKSVVRKVYIDKKMASVLAPETIGLKPIEGCSMLVITVKSWEKKNLSVADFDFLRQWFLKTHGNLPADKNLQDEARRPLEKDEGVRVLGCYAISDTVVSLIALTKQEVELDDKTHTELNASVTSLLLVRGKVLMILQLQLSTTPEQAEVFKDQALVNLDSMKLELGGASEPRPWRRVVGEAIGALIVIAAAAGAA